MKYLHLFDNQTDYDNEKNTLILPSASLIEDTKEVKYNHYHDYVEINGVKWATMNVGAKSITDYGLYFQWGDTQGYTADKIGTGAGKKAFSWNDCKWYDTKTSAFTKYNSTGTKTVLDLEDDAVHAAWGGSWRMPTTDEFAKLRDAVTTEWTTIDGVNGRLCTDKKDSSKTLFFPACGYAISDRMNYEGSIGGYWLSLLYSSSVYSAFSLNFNDGNVYWQNSNLRCYGQGVRGVWDDKQAKSIQ